MNPHRTVELGHITVLVFAAILLLSAHNFLIAHPLLSALLIAAFVPVYVFAARLTGSRYFIYPFLLLLVLAYNLLVYGLGAAPSSLPIFSLLPLAVIYFVGKQNLLQSLVPENSGESCYGVNALMIALFASVTLLNVTDFFKEVPDLISITLFGYAGYFALRFFDTKKVLHIIWTVIFGLSAYAYLLHSRSALALLVAAILVIRLSYELFIVRQRLLPETAFFAATAVYLILQALRGTLDSHLVLGYAAAALTMFQLGLTFHRRGEMTTLLPLFGGGIIMSTVPLYLLYPYDNDVFSFAYLLLLFAAFVDAGRGLRARERTLLGVALSQFFGVTARIVLVAAFAYLVWKKFPASYGLAILAFGFAYLSMVTAFRTPSSILKRRSLYIYVAGIFLTASYMLATLRLAPTGIAAALLASGFLLLFSVLLLGYAFRKKLSAPQLNTVYDVAAIAAIGGGVHQALRTAEDLPSALLVAGLLIAVSLLFFFRTRLPSVLYTVTVVIGLLVYVGSIQFGVSEEALGLPFLALGFAGALGAFLTARRESPWQNFFYFVWYFCLTVSLVLFFPFKAVGTYAAPFWAIAFLMLAGFKFIRSDRPFSLVLEILGHLFAAAAIAYLLISSFHLQASIALFIYAALYAYLCLRDQQKWYLYPASLFAAAGYFFMIYGLVAWQIYLVYSIPLAAIFYTLIALLRRRALPQFALPINLAAVLNTIVGALLFLLFPTTENTLVGWMTGVIYLAIYVALIRLAAERAFLAGVGLSAAFAVYHLLWYLPFVTAANHLAYFAPMSLLLAIAGWRLTGLKDRRGQWALYSAAITVALLASFFALWPEPTASGASRVVLLITMAVWLLLLNWTGSEVFIYLASLALAMLAYNFLQTTTDRFGQHMFVFFLYGAALLGIVFATRAVRNYIRFRRPILFVEGKKWSERFVYFTPIVLIVAATLGGFSIESTSNPRFCGLCHSMKDYYVNWQTSRHGKTEVGCAACHYEPGFAGYAKAKTKGFSELVKEITATAKYKPEATVSDKSCLRSGCHAVEKLGEVKNQKFSFDHSIHIGSEVAGVELRCTSCHSKVGTEIHFAVDEQACFSCHFSDKQAASQSCIGCHGIPEKPVGAEKFQHRLFVRGTDDAQCQQCHTTILQGISQLVQTQCSACHLEQPADLLKTETASIHHAHVTEQSIKCGSCHSTVRHAKKPHLGETAALAADCSSCHGKRHSEPELLFAGLGGIGVAQTPDRHFVVGVECAGCHAESDAEGKVNYLEARHRCRQCHDASYEKIADQWKTDLSTELSSLALLERKANAHLQTIPPDNRARVLELLQAAQRNIELVRKGNGVHNYDYAKLLLLNAKGFLKKALSGSAAKEVASNPLGPEEKNKKTSALSP